jgi:hypothetical protein
MRIFKNRQCIVNTYLTTGDAWRVRWNYSRFHTERSGRESYEVALDVRKGFHGRWKEIFSSYCGLGACGGELDLYALVVACAAYPGSDDDGRELPHPAASFPGLLHDLSCAESDLQEKADRR